MIVLSRVEMTLFNIILTASPYDRYTKSKGITGFKIHALSLISKIGDKKPTLPDFRNNPVINLIVMLFGINTFHCEPSFLFNGFNTILENFD